MAGEKVQGSYLYELKPFVDKKAWQKAAGSVDEAIKSAKGSMSFDEWKGKKNSLKEELKQISQLKKELNDLETARSKATGNRLNAINDLIGTKSYTDEKGIEHRGTGIQGDLERSLQKAELYRAELESSGPSKMEMFSGKLSEFSSKISAASAAVTALYAAMKKAINGAIDLVNKQTELSNQLDAQGAFGNMSTRNMMARYGISSTRATAMQNTLSLMGLSESDIGRMNAAQRRTYDELIKYYEDGINKIDPTKLKEYYKTLEEFQTAQAKWKMDLQTTFLKMLAESDSFKKLTGSLENFFEKTIQFLESDVVQWFLNTFIEFLSSIVDIASTVLGWFGGGSGNSTTNNTNNNSTNTYYIYGSDSKNNSDLARQIALKQTSPLA